MFVVPVPTVTDVVACPDKLALVNNCNWKELFCVGSNVTGPVTNAPKSTDIFASLVAEIVIGLLIPVIGTILLTTTVLGAVFVKLVGAVKEASVSGPLFVVIAVSYTHLTLPTIYSV